MAKRFPSAQAAYARLVALNPERTSSSELVPTYSYPAGGKDGHSIAAAGKGAKYGDHL